MGFTTFKKPANRVKITDADGKEDYSPVTAAELEILDGSTSSSGVTPTDSDRLIINDNGTMRQTVFSKLFDYISAKFSGAISSCKTSNLTSSRVVVTNSSGKLATSSTVSTTELERLNGIGANVQDQINARARKSLKTAGQVKSNGLIDFVYKGSFNVTRVGTGHYKLSSLSYIPVAYSQLYVEPTTDGDNLISYHNKSTTTIEIKFRDAPSLDMQDTTFRFMWLSHQD